LEKRGNAITNANFDKMHGIEEKINKFKKCDKSYDKICRPTTGYFIFESDECVQAIKKASKTDLGFVFEEKLVHFKQAFEPSSVIWEARNWMSDWRKKVLIYTGILILFATYWYYYVKMTQMIFQMAYLKKPAITDCDAWLMNHSDD
jgi:hypothetical protein